MSYTLPGLPFSMDALNPVISTETIEFHYLKHHQAYVNNLNKLTENTDWVDSSFIELIKQSEGAIFNNAAQVWNHSFYWSSLTAGGNELKKGALLDAILAEFGSLEALKDQMVQASVTLFGSGWSWLVVDEKKSLKILQGANAWNPLKENLTPLLTIDVWEHAYYLDYQNRRPDYISALCKIIDWEKVNARFEESSPLLSI